MSGPDTLEVEVERVLYPSEVAEGARWFILSAYDPNRCNIVCKGEMAWRPRVGERLKLTGKWTEYQGKRQFAFGEAMLNIPTDSRGLLQYVCSMARGVGPALEQAIWDKCGKDWPKAKEGEVPRLNPRAHASLMEAIETAEQERDKSRIISELIKAGATINMASGAFELWGRSTMGIVKANPYRLAELPHYGFADVDGAIRRHYGIEDADPRRIRSAIIYVLRQLTGSGSTVVHWEQLHAACIDKLHGYSSLIVEQVREMFVEGTLKGFEASRNVALAGDYKNELTIWEFLNA